jgi:lipopolysaccharide transport system ATP-binding protein
VTVEAVSKKFGLSVKSALKYGLLDSGRRLMGRKSDHALRPGEFWALNDISFTLEPGDALGIMGVNGSGKTTLLRILNGTYCPDRGKVTLRGQVGALIAAGAGFSPLLSGRENVYISGTLLGMTPREIKHRFDEIVAFAELGDFIDMPVRNYSSGMSVRLGFAIAVIGTPEILLVDEVLAVGDINFQKKCFERIQYLKQQGTTILLVSHSPGAIWSVCSKGLVIQRGETDGILPVEDACRLYDHCNMLERMKSSNQPHPDHLPSEYGGKRGGTGDVFVTKLEILDNSYRPVTQVSYGTSFVLRHHVDVRKPIKNGIFRTQIDAEINKSIAIVDSYEAHNSLFSFEPGKYVIDIEVKEPNLRPGVYEFCPSITEKTLGIHLFYQYGMGSLAITHPPHVFFYADFRASVYLSVSYVVRPQAASDHDAHVH